MTYLGHWWFTDPDCRNHQFWQKSCKNDLKISHWHETVYYNLNHFWDVVMAVVIAVAVASALVSAVVVVVLIVAEIVD